jgi:hypothetical protein
MSVFVNGRSVVHKGDGKTQIAAAPDACKTPSPGGPVPVPYPNMAQDSALSGGTQSVQVEGNPAALESSSLSTSSGNEAGTAGGGLVSSKIKGKLGWISYSLDVKFDGQGVVRFFDVCMHNGNTHNTGGQGAQGSPTPTAGKSAGKCPPHVWKQLSDTNSSADRLKKLENSAQPGEHYNACVAKKLMSAGRSVEVSLRFKCDCGQYQEVDLLVDGAPAECKAGNQGAKKKQTLNYIEISNQLYGGKSVTVFIEGADRAARDAPHVANWGADVQHMPC